MTFRKGFQMKNTLTAMLLIGTASCVSLAAHAQDMDMSDDEIMMPKNPYSLVFPLSLNYPMVSPGAIDQMHYTDASRTKIRNGSVSETEAVIYRNLEKKMDADIAANTAKLPADYIAQNEVRYPVDVLDLTYPVSSPGAIDQFHYTDYTKTQILSGSASEMRVQMARKQTEQHMMDYPMMAHPMDINDEDEEAADPLALGYPAASPGTLDQMHYTDYTKTKIRNGSLDDVRAMQMRKETEKNMQMRGDKKM